MNKEFLTMLQWCFYELLLVYYINSSSAFMLNVFLIHCLKGVPIYDNWSLLGVIATTLVFTGKDANTTYYIQEAHYHEDDAFVLVLFFIFFVL